MMRSRVVLSKQCLSVWRAAAGLAPLLLSALAFTGRCGAVSGQVNAEALEIPLGVSAPTVEADPYRAFTLRHIFHHGTYEHPQLHRRLDVTPQGDGLEAGVASFLGPSMPIKARSQPVNIHRLADRRLSAIDSYLSEARVSGIGVSLASSAWTMDEILGPNVTDKGTILSLARASADAYVETPEDTKWQDIGQGFNLSQSFGWQTDGLRGHVFADAANATVLMALKGTTAAVFDGEGTTTKDKVNDNLFFSCCCAEGGQFFWRQVCDCYSTTYTCNQTCLVRALKNENRYYRAAIELYSNVTEIYPQSNVWLTGHSLGGAVSSLLGLTFGIPTVTFEAPGEGLAASRLGLPAPPDSAPGRPATRKNTGIHHFGNTADPVFMGTCNGFTDACTLGGYAMETQCHAGLQCVYDTVTDFGWSVGIANHPIQSVIDNVLEKYETPPNCLPDDECVDCFNWKYFESNASDPTTSSSSTTTKIRTRTSTCETPGWWGCLDETSTASSTSSSATTSTSTCKTPGWFWCNDPTTTTSPTSSSASSPTASPALPITPTSTTSTSQSSSTSCHHPGWFGCRDPTSSSSRSDTTALPYGCLGPGWSGDCHDARTTEFLHPITSVSSPTPSTSATQMTSSSTCTHSFFFGLICLDSASVDEPRTGYDAGFTTTTS